MRLTIKMLSASMNNISYYGPAAAGPSDESIEGEIRITLVIVALMDCMVALFSSTITTRKPRFHSK